MYINIISISLFMMSLYVLYSRFSVNKTDKNFILLQNIIIILLLKVVYIIHNESLISFNYVYLSIAILSILQISIKDNKSKINKTGFYINLILGYVLLALHNLIQLKSYMIFLAILVVMNTLCISIINFIRYKINLLNFFTITLMIFGLCLYMLNPTNSIIKTVNCVLEIICSIYIFNKTFNINLKDRYNLKVEINEKLQKSNIKLKEVKENLKLNGNITNTINESIKRKQDLLKVIIGENQTCTFIIDKNGYILNEDKSFTNMWQCYSEYSYKIELSMFLNDNIKDKNKFLKCIEKTMQGKDVESEIRGKEGRVFKCIYAPFLVGNQNIGTICAMTDITYKKTSEIKIKENNIKYSKIVDTIPYTILIADENQILYNNNKNKNVDFYRSDMKKILLKKLITGEICYKDESNEQYYLNIDRARFNDDESEKSLIVVRDITKYKKLLGTVEYSKEKYESLVNVIPEGIYISDIDNKNINYSNKVLSELLQFNDFNIINLENELKLEKLNKNAESINFKRKLIKDKYGQDTYIECGEMVIEINKKMNKVGIVRDITEQVKAETIEREIEIKKKEHKIKSDFFVNISHELKTPLNVITSSNQLLEIMNKEYISKNPNSEISKAIEIVKKHTYMLMGLIDNIMDLAKLESQFHECNKDYYNIVSIVEDVCDEFNKYVSVNGIEILFDTDEEERIAEVDPDDVEKIILTLLAMIIRYSYSSSMINVDLSSTRGKMNICIKNKGGYDYDRYINDQERRSLDIGTTVVKSIIELYNGKIDIKVGSKKDIEINIDIEINDNIQEYKRRVKLNGDDFIYTEYLRMCNF
ncbi:PAS domain-containing sensor histidine kinase [Romboutsia lituseburensis]|uniref:PAS domain-containing sensor histidine kinase n=1 Tax=Romboutsia lituseburensis TaxID=1537 RepID=UPI00215A8944|nr:HAMP domain-containing histidine kinase [Romboutsia lituseburensis]MCR8745207.1 HAMP domain-containing histidine kinase [Romboutsia lituseburensis]